VVETEILTLDRMAIEEAGPNPDNLAAAIHAQLKLKNGAIPIDAIARALDIISIRDAALPGVEGALIMPENRNWGAIFTKAHTTPQRRRYTIGHELGHFLNLWHEPPKDEGFACTAKDLSTGWRAVSKDAGQHRLQESQANRFAIEPLAPARRVEPFPKPIPDLEQVIALSADLDISREAAARRYVELCERPIAVVFGHERTVRYVDCDPAFPKIRCCKGDPLPSCETSPDRAGLTGHVQSEPREWLAHSPQGDLLTQRLFQANGYSITLLMLDEPDEEEAMPSF
jgi:Zn-dependent peptidase ImmA (M78 family)